MWTSSEAIAIYIAIGVVAAGVVAWLILRGTVRTRLETAKQIRDDPDINEWLVIFDWSNKILYVPTILASILAGVLVLCEVDRAWVGGIWFVIFFVNVLVEEYELNIKVLLIGALCLTLLFLWLNLLGWVRPFLRFFRSIAVEVNATLYFLVAALGLIAVGISWFRGLFFYVALTPNYLNIQEGPTESGEHIGREDYNSRVDTRDFLERLMGFGRIVIIFNDRKRQPLVMLVWRIKKKAASLEAIRATISVEQRLSPVQARVAAERPTKTDKGEPPTQA
ncbi:MAG: hypothetical protein AMS16_01710 [Planctomycetes bacterium DG_58]|nr:MAG: hypothetical protein AMS16_01710 [Planctomycetes bacterium DG_58]